MSQSWVKSFPGAITICDSEGVILEMNDKAIESFDEDGGEELIGKNLLNCHPESARSQLEEMLKSQRPNCYTIEKHGIKRLIYQNPWYDNGHYSGFVEISLTIPFDMPHFIRKEKEGITDVPFLEWKDSYNIGVKEIDNQHRGLFDIISKLVTSRLYEPDGKYFFLTLNKFLEYAQVHFATEERYMQRAQYPKFIEHQREHELFIIQVSELAQDIEKKEPEIEDKTLNFLKDWYLAHILGTDRDLEQWFRAKGIK